jgi:hypothetical protein
VSDSRVQSWEFVEGEREREVTERGKIVTIRSNRSVCTCFPYSSKQTKNDIRPGTRLRSQVPGHETEVVVGCKKTTIESPQSTFAGHLLTNATTIAFV